MKQAKRFAALLLVAAVMVLQMPVAALAAEGAGILDKVTGSYAIGTLTETTEDDTSVFTPTPTPAPTPTPTPTSEASPTPEKKSTQEQGISGQATVAYHGGASAATLTHTAARLSLTQTASTKVTTFTPMTSVPVYTSDLTFRVYLSEPCTLGSGNTLTVSNIGGNFTGLGATAKLGADGVSGAYIDVTGLKYANNSGNTLKFTLSAGGASKEYSFAVGECAVAVPEPTTPAATPEPTAAPDPRAPGLIVRSSALSSDTVDAGAEFTLSLTVYATSSGTENITDVIVSIAPEKGVVITNGSSTQYIGTMAPGSSKTVSFPMQALSDFTEGVSQVAVSLSGTGATSGTAAATTGSTISVPINQPDRFEIGNLSVPASIMVGSEDMVSISFVNKGKNSVNNLTVSMQCDNVEEGTQSQYMGNLAAGTEDSADFDLMPLSAGQITGTITITYEAPSGSTVNLTQDFSLTAEEGYYDGMMDDGGMGMDDMPVDGDVGGAGLPWWGIALIVVAGVAVLVVIIVVVRKRKAKKAQLEAEDEDL